MDVLLQVIAAVGGAVERVFGYVENHHWVLGLLALFYVFHLHDKSIHARFDVLEKRIDEIRKRLRLISDLWCFRSGRNAAPVGRRLFVRQGRRPFDPRHNPDGPATGTRLQDRVHHFQHMRGERAA